MIENTFLRGENASLLVGYISLLVMELHPGNKPEADAIFFSSHIGFFTLGVSDLIAVSNTCESNLSDHAWLCNNISLEIHVKE